MKRFVLLSILAIAAIILKAQTDDSSFKTSKDVIYKTISKKMRIEDKIFIKNKTPYYILQIAVAIPQNDGEFEPLGVASYIAPNETFNMANFKNNSLKQLRGRTIAIKAKGARVFAGEHNSTSVDTPYGSVGVKHKELNPEIINNIKKEDYTYDFDVKLYENRHDLYIEVFSSGENGNGIMDF